MTPEQFRERFGTPSHPEGCPVLIAAALEKEEAENAKLRFLISEVIETQPVTEACREDLRAALKT